MKYRILFILRRLVNSSFFPSKKIRLLVRYMNKNGKNNVVILVKENGRKIYNPRIKNLHVNYNGFCNNIIEIYEPLYIKNLNINYQGNNNVLTVEKSVRIRSLSVKFGDGSAVRLGEGSSFFNVSMVLANTRNSITIGKNCMFSYDVELRAGDSHTIYDIKTKEVLNFPKDVAVGNHVWLCAGAKLLKGTKIPDNCVVGANSLVTGQLEEPNCIIAGSPAKVIKTGVNWHGCSPYNWDSYKDFN